MADHLVTLLYFPGKLVGAAIDRIDPRRAFGQQHVGEAAGRASYIHRYGVIHIQAEMFQGVRQLDPAARNPGMIATPQLNSRLYGHRMRSEERRVGKERVSKCSLR